MHTWLIVLFKIDYDHNNMLHYFILSLLLFSDILICAITPDCKNYKLIVYVDKLLYAMTVLSILNCTSYNALCAVRPIHNIYIVNGY